MKKNTTLIIMALLLVGLIAATAVLYNKLSKEHGQNNLITTDDTSDNTTDNTTDDTTDDTSENQKYAAPDFTVFDKDGNPVRLSDYKGKPVVLNFWATWCYYCKEEMPDFNEAYKLYPDVQFLMVNATDGVQETMETAKKYIEKENFDFDVFYDTELQALNAYSVNSFPQTFFIDAKGNLIAQGSGMLDMDSLKRGIAMITE